MSKSKNHTNHNQGHKHHKNGIKKIKKTKRFKYKSLKGVNTKFLRNRRRAIKNDQNQNIRRKKYLKKTLKEELSIKGIEADSVDLMNNASHEEKEQKEEKKEKKEKEKIALKEIPLINSKINLLPVLTLAFDYDCDINENLYDNFKKELSSLIGSQNFSIIDIAKGSAILKIALINDLAKKGIKASMNNSVSDEVQSVLKKIETKRFVCLGNNCATNTKYNIPDYSNEENRKKLVNFLKESSQKNEDLLQATETISDEDFNKILDEKIGSLSDALSKQEINQKRYILNNLEEFNKQIETILEEAKKDSIFEFNVTGISLIDRNKENYLRNKSNCNNIQTKFLFHGTSTDVSSLITITNFRKANVAFFGPGIYMTDMLDYSGFYAYESNTASKFSNHHQIRKVNDTFTIVASQIYYDNSKYERCYDISDEKISENGIRHILVNAQGRPLSKNTTKANGYNKFIGTEFVIPSENQILPLYSITLKRSEYYCLWKDYHFTHQTSFTEHALHVKNYAKQLLGINVYGVGEIDEALNIIKRKKYNKVILLSNVGSDIEKAKKFVNDIRAILKFNVVILFFTSKISHLNWIKELPNALFTTSDKHFKEYISNFTTSGLNSLKTQIEKDYNTKFNNFYPDLSYPLFNEANSKNYDNITID